MAFSTNDKANKKRYVSEINVTPLVDVMLVLLIIFMVTAPMMTKGLDVKLPEVTAKPLPQKKESLVITIKDDGKIFLKDIQVDEEVLRSRLYQKKQEGSLNQLLLRADKAVPYGTVAAVMAAVREAGIENLGLVTSPVEKKRSKRQGAGGQNEPTKQ